MFGAQSHNQATDFLCSKSLANVDESEHLKILTNWKMCGKYIQLPSPLPKWTLTNISFLNNIGFQHFLGKGMLGQILCSTTVCITNTCLILLSSTDAEQDLDCRFVLDPAQFDSKLYRTWHILNAALPKHKLCFLSGLCNEISFLGSTVLRGSRSHNKISAKGLCWRPLPTIVHGRVGMQRGILSSRQLIKSLFYSLLIYIE